MKIGVLAVQGAFLEHEKMLECLGAECIELRQKSDTLLEYDGLVLPGGESTVQGKLLRELDMFDIIQKQIAEGMPVLATCAGLILLAEHISNDEKTYFQTMPITVKRNAYGRQLGSFHTIQRVGAFADFPLEFIRAPYVEEVGEQVEILAETDGKIVGVRYKNQTGFAFHPELTRDTRIHEEFLKSIQTGIKF